MAARYPAKSRDTILAEVTRRRPRRPPELDSMSRLLVAVLHWQFTTTQIFGPTGRYSPPAFHICFGRAGLSLLYFFIYGPNLLFAYRLVFPGGSEMPTYCISRHGPSTRGTKPTRKVEDETTYPHYWNHVDFGGSAGSWAWYCPAKCLILYLVSPITLKVANSRRGDRWRNNSLPNRFRTGGISRREEDLVNHGR